MRVRQMDSDGDMTFGQSSANFLVNSPAAVGQACQTRLGLWTGEWFLNTAEGTPYTTQVLGSNTQTLYDAAIQERVLDTPGMVGIAEYQSSLDHAARVLTISMIGITQYGTTDLLTIPFQIG